MIYYNNEKVKLSNKILNNEEYKKICNLLEKEIQNQNQNDKINNTKIINNLKIRKITFILNQEEFFLYLKNMKVFLNGVDKNFNKRFKNFELNNIHDQMLFEN